MVHPQQSRTLQFRIQETGEATSRGTRLVAAMSTRVMLETIENCLVHTPGRDEGQPRWYSFNYIAPDR